ncbi:MAG: Beta,3-glucosyltransferase [Deltaproteobacteria bacterium]|nr:Beta,3-glucosyltransferase [Deltaproteobacteria bacterium]
MPGAKVSVVMTFFNEPPHKLARSIGSILAQTLIDIEFIVVPGNPSNTGTIREVEAMALADARLSLLTVSAPLPMGTCLNMAIRKASAPFVALQEADDASRPGRLAAQMAYMESHPEVHVLGTALAYIDERNGREIVRRSYPQGTAAFRRYAAIAHPTVFVRREVYDRCGFYDESGDWRHCPDYELWLRWLTQGVRFHTIPDLLFDYYQSDENGRNRNVKPTLRSNVRLKRMYRDRLGFTVGDRAYLALEAVLLLFPGRWIAKLFYLWVRVTSPAIRVPRPA